MGGRRASRPPAADVAVWSTEAPFTAAHMGWQSRAAVGLSGRMCGLPALSARCWRTCWGPLSCGAVLAPEIRTSRRSEAEESDDAAGLRLGEVAIRVQICERSRPSGSQGGLHVASGVSASRRVFSTST